MRMTEVNNFNILQRILFPDIMITGEEDLYYHKVSGYCTIDQGMENGLLLQERSMVNFGSYFNAFSCSNWERYCHVRNVRLMAELCGKAEVTLYHEWISYGEVQRQVIKKIILDASDERRSFYLDFGEACKDGTFSFAIQALESTVRFYGGCYLGEVPAGHRDVKLAVVITTFRREAYVSAILNGIRGLQDDRIHVYVVDNGKTLKLPPSEFHDVIPNENTGGAGGFARGMKEVDREREKYHFTHFILMDDDVTLDPRVLIRVIDFLKCVAEEYHKAFIGGAMLRRDIAYFQVESGAKRTGLVTQRFGYGLDMRNPYHCLLNELPRREEYNAWWFCCIPIGYLRSDNYPMPLFFQWDDVDYGVRNSADVILCNGICVWHDPFESKQSLHYLYYSLRNSFIVDACHEGRQSLHKFLSFLRLQLRKKLYLYQYEEAMMALQAVNDFLKGADWLCAHCSDEHHQTILSQDRALEKIQEIDYQWYRFCSTIKDCDRFHALLRKLSFNGMLLKPNRAVILPIHTDQPVLAYRAKQILYYDELTGKGFFTEKSIKKLLLCIKEYRKIKRIVKRTYEAVGKEYRERYPYLTSEEQWRFL